MPSSPVRFVPLVFWITTFCIADSAVLRAQETAPAPAGAASFEVSERLLNSRGFVLDGHEYPVCTIDGSDGPCGVEAFVMDEKEVDPTAHTCAKLNKSSYVGHCVKGELDGFALVIADGEAKASKEAFLSYFLQGRLAYPAVTSDLADDDLNFGLDETQSSYGCVYFGKWNQAKDRCGRFIKLYGDDFFTESNAKKLRDGTFDVDQYGAKFLELLKHD